MALNDAWEMDPTGPTSNSNMAGANVAENCSPSGINNAIRQLGTWLAQQTSYASPAISSSVSTNIAATGTGLYQSILGANVINSFGTVAGVQASAAVLRILEFSSSASISHGAKIALPGAAAIRTQPGDILGLIHEGSSDVWRGLFYSRADGSGIAASISATTITVGSISTSAISTVTLNAASVSATNIALTGVASISASVGSFTILKYNGATVGNLYIQAQSLSTNSSDSTSSNIPFDTSAPQNNEGKNIFSLSITPKSANSILEIEAIVWGAHVTTGVELQASLFLDNAASAIAAGTLENNANNPHGIRIYHEHTASTTSEHVYALRYGADSGSMLLNHGSSGNLGGTLRSWLRVRERL